AGSWYIMACMASRTLRLSTTSERKKARDAAWDKNVQLYGTITCEQCFGREGEVHDSGKTIEKFEMDHKINISTAGVDNRLRYKLETDPTATRCAAMCATRSRRSGKSRKGSDVPLAESSVSIRGCCNA